ncbi:MULTISPECIES: metallophosphoesterase [unclassified Pseudomonas]|uniref:metallophosphoesterase n=1 Tax=unclassified Pseudomonas TaxID=196821 RepID=UPI000753AB26|nr:MULTISPECIES: metallophosphoesterase [unclassified Pseudomonas]KVV02287.1 putative phosphoesterase [Pseudomonas sp. TAD18]KVV04001.1 putative phosphoesterase [Pseudomonas sp. TAA207]
MRVYILSDLHLEFSALQLPPFAPGSLDLVVLAGDIHKLDKGVRWANETFSCDVLYVMGNHEFYAGHFDRTLQKARAAAQSHVHVLENECYIAGRIRFLGTSGWTDFSSTGDVIAATNMARSMMTDYRAIRADQNYRRLRPDDVASRNHQAKQWLTEELEKPFAGKTVVITHHAPIIEVCGGEHEGHLNAAYCNTWHALVHRADAWIFGHTHHSTDVELSGCRLISNQRGYPEEECGFDLGKIVEF